MTRIVALFCFIALVAVSCTIGVSRIQTRSLPYPNPTSYTFPLPVEEVRIKAMQTFSIRHQTHEPVFGRLEPANGFEDIFSAECYTNAHFGKEVFGDPANTNDVYLHTYGPPFEVSSVYYGRDGGLPFSAVFHLHLTGSGSNTLVTVTASDTKVVNGRRFGFNPCGLGYNARGQRVKPTTLEEYSILRYLGRYLGVTNMPDVVLPSQ